MVVWSGLVVLYVRKFRPIWYIVSIWTRHDIHGRIKLSYSAVLYNPIHNMFIWTLLLFLCAHHVSKSGQHGTAPFISYNQAEG